MPKSFLTAGMIITSLIALSAFTYKKSGTATVSGNYCIDLGADSIVYDTYLIDISHLDLASEHDADNKFGFISSNLVDFQVNFTEKKVLMLLLKKHLGEKTWLKSDWEKYFQSRCNN